MEKLNHQATNNTKIHQETNENRFSLVSMDELGAPQADFVRGKLVVHCHSFTDG